MRATSNDTATARSSGRPFHYRLNHRGIGWNDSGAALQEIDVFIFDIYLSREGNSYTGTFSLTAYDEYGTPKRPPMEGTIIASRIMVTIVKPDAFP